jgi:hypothetical protein
MKLSILLIMVLTAFVSVAPAAPLCAGGTMASYEALGSGGCVIGDKLFSNFKYGSTALGAGIAVLDTQILLTPVVADIYNPGAGIIFSSDNWVLSASEVDSMIDSSILFTVTVLSGEKNMEDGTLTLLSAPKPIGTGVVADLTETINPAGIQLHVAAAGSWVSHDYFPITNTVSVAKDLFLYVPAGAPGSGFAQINSFEEDFSEAPEPVSGVLIGSGLLGLGLWRRRAASRG